ncbi:NAD-dependent epimerase/dehydratase family protein [Microvirga subterranea]|uniref:Nucleoside-diphosphate-sugar epimerase n=1 Tax=Microvirga subterranea TaxID=186651 RepID=A0A370HCP1_9HYPH|nr:NAD(P)-dependent oxidoreductase [Microvirga subterranea]RDI54839.1 nucleoside-diphosphate-sugar epimerase [Microvirga subterranea]
MSSSRSILVTGGTGLIGQHVCAVLAEEGHWVTSLGRSQLSSRDPRVAFLSYDLRDPDALPEIFRGRSFDTLIHLAWETTHGRFWHAPENLDWVAASLRLIRLFADAGGSRVVAAGTCVEYRAPGVGPCVAGETEVAPAHLYAVAKDAFHRVLRSFCSDQRMSYAWGRIFMLIGPGEHPNRLVPSIVRSILRSEPARCSSGTQVRDFMDVRDCGAAFAALALSSVSGPINICSGTPVTIAEVIRTAAAFLGRPDLVRLGALPDRPNEAPNLWGDAGPLSDVTGYRATYSLSASLQAAIDHWRSSEQALVRHAAAGVSE